MLNLKEAAKTHNAFLLEAKNSHDALSFLKDALKEELESADFTHFDFGSLSVEDARFIKDFLLRKSAVNGARYVSLFALHVSELSQNSLLKAIEELGVNTKLFFFVKNKNEILQTLSSRMFFWDASDTNFASEDFEEFFSKDEKGKLAELEKWRKEKNREKIFAFFDFLEARLIEEFSRKREKMTAEKIKRLAQAKRAFAENITPGKALLEALVLEI